jgi:predicted transcriptional regulator
MTDQEIISDIAKKINILRRTKALMVKDVASKGGVSIPVIAKFESKTNDIKISTFIKILRGIGELEQLENILSIDSSYSPIEEDTTPLPKRIRRKKIIETDFTWEEDK